MEITTKIFGKVTIGDDRIIKFPNGIVGFPDLQNFALMYDSENTDGNSLNFLVSLDEPAFALPVMVPSLIDADYDPAIADDYLIPLGEFEDGMLELVTVTVPHDVTKMTVNLMAPIVVNVKTKKAVQVIVDDDNYPVKFPIYDILAQAKQKAESAGKAGEQC